MAPQTPTGKTQEQIAGLGTLQGHVYANGVRQFVGIPYGKINKRWTRSKLNESWANNFHDGTKLGPSAPNPPEYNSATDIVVPAAPIPHHPEPVEDELNCLVMNIVIPPRSAITDDKNLPVMVYIHGGSFLYGGANRPVFDGVNIVSYSVSRGTPVVAVNFNYRVGLGGFLASSAIKADLERDGFEGVGNFGLYDQQIALAWVNKHIPSLGGNPNDVTIYGESAGGMSVAHQIAAKTPAPFKRAIAMSGLLNTIPPWSLEHHERHYRALLTYLKIDPDTSDSLEQLRRIPQEVIAAATLPVEGIFVYTGNPCDDGVFHAKPPSFDGIESPPSWLEAYMVGDTYHEAIIFRGSFAEDNYDSLRKCMISHLGESDTDTVLSLYNILPELSVEDFLTRLEELASDTTFRAHNWVSVHKSAIDRTFGYHFDQLSTEENPLKGLAYHALDLLYVFLNFNENLTPSQQKLAFAMADHFLDFAYGNDPWARLKHDSRWMVYGPESICRVVTEEEDEPVRKYQRVQKIIDMNIYERLVAAIDGIACKRWRMGTFEWTPTPLPKRSSVVDSSSECKASLLG